MDASSQSAAQSGIDVTGFAGLVTAVADVNAARDFYVRILGCTALGSDMLPGLGRHHLLATASGGLIALAEGMAADGADSGVHHAYRAGAAGREAIRARLAAAGIAVHGYREDREAEQDDRFYFLDPDNNRIQIVTRSGIPGDGVAAIDHVAVQLPDMMWGEEFYRRTLGLAVESRFGLRTADHARARLWAKGEDDMAPGTRRNDKLYMMMGGQSEVPRTNMQIYFRAGDSVLGVYLATRHVQEPPEENLSGAPRLMLAASRAELDRAAERLALVGRAFEGPVDHPASAPLTASLYFKDTGGNFIEICVPGNPRRA